MHPKSFLQPTRTKIFLAAALFILSVPFLEVDTGIRCITIPCPASAARSVAEYLSLSRAEIIGFHYPSLLAGLAISYFLACFLVSVCGKSARRKK